MCGIHKCVVLPFISFTMFTATPLKAVCRCSYQMKGPFRIMSQNVDQRSEKNTDKPDNSRTQSTVDDSEIKLHEGLRNQWWNKDGPMKALHSLNKLRVPFIRDGLLNTLPIIEENRDTPYPLSGLNLLDIGSGGGILSEPLARLGANVTGLDAGEHLVTLAQGHARGQGTSIANHLHYVHNSIEDFCQMHYEYYDGVVASEIVEHVNQKDLFIESCIKVLKPGGSIFVTTLNKTNLSWIGGIILAENLLRIVPKGTHHWDKFISPDDLSRLLDKYECKTKLIHGMVYVFINNDWYWTSNSSVNYALHAVKKIT